MKKEEISNIDIIIYALYILGGDAQKIHSEDIALECFKLSPSRFSWIKHTKYPSLESVRRPLISARSQEGGILVSGRHGKTKENQVADGWILTPNGINWIKNNFTKIELFLGNKQTIKKRTEVGKKIYELKNSTAFKKYFKNGDCKSILPYEFTNFLNANLDSPSSILRDRLDMVRATAATAKEEKILDFINNAEKYFTKLINK